MGNENVEAILKIGGREFELYQVGLTLRPESCMYEGVKKGGDIVGWVDDFNKYDCIRPTGIPMLELTADFVKEVR